jgi:hypothetical protein
MKQCKKCNRILPPEKFPITRANVDGRGGSCRDCTNAERRIRARKRYAENPEWGRAKSRTWWRKERFKTALIHSRVDAKINGWIPCIATEEEVKAAFDGKCAICGVSELECTGKLHMDHNHDTGEFRGWLCGHCNRGLGQFRDSEALLIDALHYLMSAGGVKEPDPNEGR